MIYKSPPIHRTPIYRAKAAYYGMLARCENKNGKSPSYVNVQLKMTWEEWLEWAVPQYELFDKEHPGEMPNAARNGDIGHYELGNIRVVSCSENQAEQSRRGIAQARPDGTKRCSICKDIKDIEEFSKNKSRPDGLHSNCKECQRKYSPPKPRIPKPIVHGTRAGYMMEAYRGLPHCEDCKIANKEYSKSLRA
jgi:hypothetical protein